MLIDLFTSWVAVSVALAEKELLAVFTKFAGILIFADTELIIGTFATSVFPQEKKGHDFLEFHLRKSRFGNTKKRYAYFVLVYSAFILLMFILVSTQVVTPYIFGHCSNYQS